VKRDFENSEVKLVPLSAPSPYENAKLKNPYAAFQLQNGDIVQAQNAAADLLAKVREHAEKYLVQDALQKANLTKLTHAVVTCPAHFGVYERGLTMTAARLGGFERVNVVSEPAAATLNALVECAEMFKEKQCFKLLVYDFGGGTFDVTVSEYDNTKTQPVLTIEALEGDRFLGGKDIDATLSEHIQTKYSIKLEPSEKSEWDAAIEKLKKELSSKNDAALKWDRRKYSLNQTEFDELIEAVVERTLRCVVLALGKATTGGEQITHVILVGGSSQIPYVRKQIQKQFPNAKILENCSPEESVAIGAAYRAQCLYNEEFTKDNEYPVLNCKFNEVISHSIGVRCTGDILYKLIKQGSQMPRKETHDFFSPVSGNCMINIAVFEGEEEIASQNKKLASTSIEVKCAPHIEGKIPVAFKLSFDGVLEITAEDAHNREVTAKCYAGPFQAARIPDPDEVPAVGFEDLEVEAKEEAKSNAAASALGSEGNCSEKTREKDDYHPTTEGADADESDGDESGGEIDGSETYIDEGDSSEGDGREKKRLKTKSWSKEAVNTSYQTQ
jgi:molecular chaperone DnaK (HSP70)